MLNRKDAVYQLFTDGIPKNVTLLLPFVQKQRNRPNN